MYRSKVLLTEDEKNELVKLWESARSTPVIAFSGAHAATGGASADARRRFIRRIDELAAAHGLKLQAGEWGLDPSTRQFLGEYPIDE